MRDYILTQSIARDSTFAFPKLRRMFRSWVLKRNLKVLDALEGHLLDDIGLAREDIRHLHALPLDVDLAAEFSRLRDLRARLGADHGSEQGGNPAVKRPEPLKTLAIGTREGLVGLNLCGDAGLGTYTGGVLPQGR